MKNCKAELEWHKTGRVQQQLYFEQCGANHHQGDNTSNQHDRNESKQRQLWKDQVF